MTGEVKETLVLRADGYWRSLSVAREVCNCDIPISADRSGSAGGARVVAPGGVKEIGRKMTMFEHAGRLLVVDWLGDEGVDLLLADSTNAEVSGFNASERDVGAVVAHVIAKTSRRIIVARFASNVHRVQQVLDAAACDRRVALVGRSMVRNMQIARELGLLREPDGLLVDLDAAEQ